MYTLPRKVVLYAHNLENATPTGIGQYCAHLIESILAAPVAEQNLAYAVGASRPSRRAAGPGSGAGDPVVLRPRLSRRTLHFLWTATRWPRADAALEDPDLIHVLSPYTAVRSKAPAIYTVHDLLPLTSPDWYTAKESWTFRGAMADAVRRSPLIITNSQTTADEVTKVYGVEPSRTRVVYLGVDDRFFEPLERAEIEKVCRSQGVTPGSYVVAIGSVSARKNLEPVIQAVDRLRGRTPPLVLLAVGPPGDGYDQTRMTVSRMGLDDLVRFTGWLPDHDVRHLVGGALALVHPSRYEGFGLTPLEAMASGVPAVVSEAGSLPEVTGGAALTADADDPDAWAGQLEQLRDDAGIRSDLIGRGRERAALFTWQRAATETIAAHVDALALI
jgi:glycosyltransferase involved in cell wall biosynthesis